MIRLPNWQSFVRAGKTRLPKWQSFVPVAMIASCLGWAIVCAQEPIRTICPLPNQVVAVDLLQQTRTQASAKSVGCLQCHQTEGDPHGKDTVSLGCVDCHGGNAATNVKEEAHVHPRYPDA